MKTIEVSDEVYAAIEGIRASVDPTAADFVAILLLSALAAASPKTFEEQWSEIKKNIPAIPVWEQWADFAENLAGPIRKTERVMGGAACIGNSRIPVWALVSLKKQGMNDGDLLRAYPSLQASDLEAAWSYYTVNSDEIDAQIKAQAAEDELG